MDQEVMQLGLNRSSAFLMSSRWTSVDQTVIQPHKLFRGRHSGVLLHITSLPDGDLGSSAYRFIDWLVAAGQTFWQVLPVGPVGKAGSPYSALSSFAGEPTLISKALLAKKGLHGTYTQAAKCFFKQPPKEFDVFCEQQAWWLDEWCHYAKGNRNTLAFVQFIFAKQWDALRMYARKQGIRLIGDVPIFVGADSVDVVSKPNLFRLNRKGNPTVVTGVPPDCFSSDGQRWGHPHYNWSEHKKDQFQWWRQRLRHTLTRFDVIRLDHFIGFHHTYEISARAKTARKGVWKRTPGRALLQALSNEFGNLPLIAEDLGHLTKPVERLRDDFKLPGVRITQQAIWGENSMDLPSNHPIHSVAYSGTHDTDTAMGWWNALHNEERVRARTLLGTGKPPEMLIRETLQSRANLAIIPMQDILGLDSTARMNTPATIRGNWKWKMNKRACTRSKARWLRELTRCAKRCK